jgi:hypothetical protein
VGELAVMGEPADTAAAQQTVMGDETDTGEQAAVGDKTGTAGHPEWGKSGK